MGKITLCILDHDVHVYMEWWMDLFCSCATKCKNQTRINQTKYISIISGLYITVWAALELLAV